MPQESLTAMTLRLPAALHDEMKKAARVRGFSAAQFAREVIEGAVLGGGSDVAQRASLTAVLWISDYLRVASKRDKDELAQMWEAAEHSAESLLCR